MVYPLFIFQVMTLHKPVVALLTFVLLSVASLFVGVANMNLESLLAGDSHAIEILISSRIPRLFAIGLAGAGLSVAGLIMQQIMQNRFAAPSTTGTIDCAMLGYIVTLVLFAHFDNWLQLAIIMHFRCSAHSYLCALSNACSLKVQCWCR
ncbi:iron compound ABC transporter permease protein [Vibrio astriarenae]|nr:iron compound ABC transporter permease protein [Vibrio sp. C7]